MLTILIHLLVTLYLNLSMFSLTLVILTRTDLLLVNLAQTADPGQFNEGSKEVLPALLEMLYHHVK